MMPSHLLQNKFIHRALTFTLLLFVTLTLTSVWAAPQEEEGTGIPAYNAGPPPKGTKLPAILTKDQLWGADAQHPYQTHAYELAAKIPTVLHQQPCYCFCDRSGHNSLHSCYENTHGARCATCLKELYYSYQQHKAGKTATQIRPASSRASGSRLTWIRPRVLTSSQYPVPSSQKSRSDLAIRHARVVLGTGYSVLLPSIALNPSFE